VIFNFAIQPVIQGQYWDDKEALSQRCVAPCW